MSESNQSMSLGNPDSTTLDLVQKIAAAIGGLGLLILLVSWVGVDLPNKGFWLIISLITISLGTTLYAYQTYLNSPEGVKNNGVWFRSLTNRGLIGWIAGIVITGFYICLYWFPQLVGLHASGNIGLVALFDPLSQLLKGVPASQWFVYGTLYTMAILIFGIKFIWKYRHNRYQVIRTISVMFFQTFFAYLIPEIIESLNTSTNINWFDKDLKNMWPLDYDFFFKWHMDNMTLAGKLGTVMLIFGLLMIFVISPILTFKFGKRWYCSWVCGCGGLAETAGDSFRHLSDKTLRAWRIERWVIHLVLLFSFVMTIAVIYSYLGNDPNQYYLTRSGFTILTTALLLASAGAYLFFQRKQKDQQKNTTYIILGAVLFILGLYLVNYFSGSGSAYFFNSEKLKSWYGFYIGAIFSGIIGVGFYPILGSRVWCRFGCPMAALLGIQQKLFSRFRITTNGSQCISCGNCSTYCEMGIDVRSYAQKGQNIVRASCVGCGICAAVCPRGVLRLENGSIDLYEKTDDLHNIQVPKSSSS